MSTSLKEGRVRKGGTNPEPSQVKTRPPPAPLRPGQPQPKVWPVHPFADRFPRLDAEQLQALADDIARNGLRYPITLGRWWDEASGHPVEGILDGRNRASACRLAGVEPTYQTLGPDVDPVDFIVSSNIERRHLTAGQRSMAFAMSHPEGAKGGRGKKITSTVQVSRNSISQARSVLRELPDLAQAVLDGSVPLEVAYHQVVEVRRLAEARRQAMDGLRELSPSLAQLVASETISLESAIAAVNAWRAVETAADVLAAALAHAFQLSDPAPFCQAKLAALADALAPAK